MFHFNIKLLRLECVTEQVKIHFHKGTEWDKRRTSLTLLSMMSPSQWPSISSSVCLPSLMAPERTFIDPPRKGFSLKSNVQEYAVRSHSMVTWKNEKPDLKVKMGTFLIGRLRRLKCVFYHVFFKIFIFIMFSPTKKTLNALITINLKIEEEGFTEERYANLTT